MHLISQFAIIILVGSTPVFAQTLKPTSAELEELFQRTYGLLSASKSCHDRDSFEAASNSVVRIINYAGFKGYTIKSIKIFQANPDELINKGVKKYEVQKWISCGEVEHYVKVVDELTKKF